MESAQNVPWLKHNTLLSPLSTGLIETELTSDPC